MPRIVIAGFHIEDDPEKGKVLNTKKKYYWRVSAHTENKKVDGKNIEFKKGHLADVLTYRGPQKVFIIGVCIAEQEEVKEWAKKLQRVLKYHLEPADTRYIQQYKEYLKKTKIDTQNTHATKED
ncbi:DUF5839 family protein [Liquorilactobacillus sucicola]|nr:DUF5839 family protein [Liquorilactobacillus sucicola]